jgi:hypothetical protein
VSCDGSLEIRVTAITLKEEGRRKKEEGRRLTQPGF